ncbi:MAG: CBS domain-containing protein [Methanomicrobia archaeon]|nr:CBS domain-containing protein [Methanomicrobia archaeon]
MSIKGRFLRHTKEEIKKMLEGTELHKVIKEKPVGRKKVRFPERMEIKDIMKKPVEIEENKTIRDLLVLLKETEETFFIVVDDQEKLKGIVTESDLLKIIKKPRRKTGIGSIGYKSLLFRGAEVIGDIMTRNPIYVKPTCKLEEAARIMGDYKIRHLPVVENGKLIGSIGLKDILLVLRILI